MLGVADLQSVCVRMLARAARAAGAGSRREVRAAARRFVWRHRRDTGYLRWVLRSVVATSALALALLGLGARTSSAQATHFEGRTGAANPLNGQNNGGTESSPMLGDLDADGDLDVVSGNAGGIFSTYSVPEPLRGLMLGAGIVLLRGLDRLRRGRRGARRSGEPD